MRTKATKTQLQVCHAYQNMQFNCLFMGAKRESSSTQKTKYCQISYLVYSKTHHRESSTSELSSEHVALIEFSRCDEAKKILSTK